tara:strand:+ start:544 stop:858 length:315 start_codon:yes stop_codon:yes gene_type:complete
MSDYINKKEKKSELGPLGRGKKKKKNLSKLLTAEEFFKIKDSDQKFTGPQSTKGSLGDAINQFRVMDDKIAVKMSKGGRAMYKSGMRVCKLAKRGKGRAYGKNS